MTYRLIILFAIVASLSSCSRLSEVNRAPENVKPVPVDENYSSEDYMVEQDVTNVWTKLNAFTDHDYFVWYQGGTDQLETQEQVKLLNWINAEQPVMICVRGTGGAEKYKSLAENRVLGLINYLQDQGAGIDIVKLDYDPSFRGGRVLINSISPQLAEEIHSKTPILVIKSD